MLLWVVEILLFILLLSMWVTQILNPLLRDEPLFPLFWSKEFRLEMKEKRLRQQIHEHDLEDAVDMLEEDVSKHHKERTP